LLVVGKVDWRAAVRVDAWAGSSAVGLAVL